MWRRLVVTPAALLLTAAAPQTPKSIIENAYAVIADANARHVGEPMPPESLYSPRLRALVRQARMAAHGEAPCGLDFVFWVDGQDEDLTSATVTELPAPDADTAIVAAKFVSLRAPHELHFTFKRISGRWRLDDAASVLGTGWDLAKLLQCQG